MPQSWTSEFALIYNRPMLRGGWMKRTSRSKDNGSTYIELSIQMVTRAYFLLSARRDATAAQRFCRKTLNADHTQIPRVINVDKNAAYPPAVDELKTDEQLPQTTKLRRVKYLNNRVEQDHRFIKRLTKPGMGCGLIQHGSGAFLERL